MTITDECGTVRGYYRHVRDGEEKCEACRTARSTYERERREQQKGAGRTPDHLPYTRARHDATKALIAAHRAEFDELYKAALVTRKREAEWGDIFAEFTGEAP